MASHSRCVQDLLFQFCAQSVTLLQVFIPRPRHSQVISLQHCTSKSVAPSARRSTGRRKQKHLLLSRLHIAYRSVFVYLVDFSLHLSSPTESPKPRTVRVASEEERDSWVNSLRAAIGDDPSSRRGSLQSPDKRVPMSLPDMPSGQPNQLFVTSLNIALMMNNPALTATDVSTIADQFEAFMEERCFKVC